MPSRALLIAASIRQSSNTASHAADSRRYHHPSHGPGRPIITASGSTDKAAPSSDSPPIKLARLPNLDLSSIYSFHTLSTPTSRDLLRQSLGTMQPTVQRFFNSNAKWAQTVRADEPDFFAETAKGQSPKLLWIGCADSRVPESIVMAAKPGDIFVHRNIANQFHLTDDSALSVLTYAVNNLGVEHVAVVGHTNCGGAAACMSAAAAAKDGNAGATPLGRWLTPMTDLARNLNVASLDDKAVALRLLVEENVKAQVANVIQTDTILDAWKEGKNVQVHGWVYELEKGQIRDLGISHGPDNLLED